NAHLTVPRLTTRRAGTASVAEVLDPVEAVRREPHADRLELAGLDVLPVRRRAQPLVDHLLRRGLAVGDVLAARVGVSGGLYAVLEGPPVLADVVEVAVAGHVVGVALCGRRQPGV